MFGHKQPAGAFFVFQKFIGIFDVDVAKHVHNHRRGQKARSDTPAIVVHRFDKALFCKFRLFIVQKSQVKRAHEFCLSVRVERIFGFRHVFPISALRSVAVFLDFFQAFVVTLADYIRDFQHSFQREVGIRRRFFGVRRGKIEPLKRHYVVRLRPLAVGLSAVDEILAVFKRDVHGFCIRSAPLARAIYHKVGVPYHAFVILFEQPVVAVLFVIIKRNVHAGASPSDRTVHYPHEPVFVSVRRDLRKTAAFPLSVENVPDVLSCERRVVYHIGRRVEKHFAVARPAHALPCRAIGRIIRRVAFKRPERVFVKFVNKFVGRLELRRFFKRAVHRNRREIVLVKRHVGFDLGIPEPAVEEFRFIFVQSVFAGIMNFLNGRRLALENTLDVFERKFAVVADKFAKGDIDFLSRLCVQ